MTKKADKEMKELQKIGDVLLRTKSTTTKEGMRQYRRIERRLESKDLLNNYPLRKRWRILCEEMKELLNAEIKNVFDEE